MKRHRVVRLSKTVLRIANSAIKVAVRYEKVTGRKLGITGEIGEVLISRRLKLSLLVDPIYPGYDAIDSQGRLYQIKSARKTRGLHKGRMGTISRHKYDFLVLGLMNFEYKLKELYKLPRAAAEKLAGKHKRRNPPVRSIAIKKWQIL